MPKRSAAVRPMFAAHRPNPVLRNDAPDIGVPELFIYGEIGWDVRAPDVVAALKGLSNRDIVVHLNSPGGSVFDGVAMANALRAHKGSVTIIIDALAASIASVIALAGQELRMADNSFFMIHHAFTLAFGNADEFRDLANTLDKVDDMLVAEYEKKTEQSRKQIEDWMDAETWFSAQEALDAGFADVIGEASAIEAFSDLFNDEVFRHPPEQLVALVRSEAARAPTVRKLERVLRDAGLSRAAARSLVAGYAPEGNLRDADAGTARTEVLAAGQRLLDSIQATH